MRPYISMAGCTMALVSSMTFAHTSSTTYSTGPSSGHAPAGVMADHMHRAGEWMIGYRDTYSEYSGLATGTSDLSKADVYQLGYRMIATDMTMRMQMLDFMYAPSDDVTLMIMPHYMTMDMTMEGFMMGNPVTRAHGEGDWGDTKVSALYRLSDSIDATSHVNIGISLPTGDIDLVNRMGVLTHYGMQMGSGTYDLDLSYTHTWRSEALTFGAQAASVIRLQSENDNGYRLGNRLSASFWAAYDLSNDLSISARLGAQSVGRIKGEYNKPHATMSPMDFPENYGGDLVEAGIGVNGILPDWAARLRWGLEYTKPLYQSVNGVQLKKDQALNVSLTLSF
ncbi:MAG: hypothetical protein HWD83_08540 [Gammaproteobacteria bacterium]|nr:hypothetical protein [Gammaproteobacteria bacterium]